MPSKELSREELFALVWEKPTQGVAGDLGVSDVAIAKLCARLQVPKPPHGSAGRNPPQKRWMKFPQFGAGATGPWDIPPGPSAAESCPF